jgi:lipopolysaccharide/colanic/teichoic acid biosynthesis glycosyltransferase
MIAKRLFDLFFSGLGLIVLSPVFVVVAIWIKLDSPGPIFFRQERVGRGGRHFRIHKFRTMRSVATPQGPAITAGGDPRITRAGAFLRRHKLDELPQLIDVVRGDMSLVGPRPEVPNFMEAYPDDVRDRILSVPPGITDFASIEYREENALLAGSEAPERDYVEKILPAKLVYYDRYVRERSLWLDFALIFRTLGCLLLRRTPASSTNGSSPYKGTPAGTNRK